ncbi:ParA family protein [Rheinheimera sp.]|uniref:ParA family protein n=1 Tax=Rheinheimera sp. TaxID=1869214 RepID=UPI0040479D1B
MSKAKVIVVNIHKGGTGKSTTVINLAIEAAYRGMRVAVIDGDPTQTSVTHFNDRNNEIQEREKVGGDSKIPFIKAEYHAPETNIRPIVVELKRDYDLILIDTQGGQGLLFKSVIQIADCILIPVQTDIKAMRQLGPTLEVIAGVEENIQLNPGWEDYTVDVRILFNQAKRGTKAHSSALEMARELKNSLTFCKTIIPDIQEMRNFDSAIRGLGLSDIKHPKRACYQLLLDELMEDIHE